MGLYLNESGVLTPIAGRGDLTAIRSEMSYLGAKNLTPSKEISQTKSGVTFTVDSDGVVTLNGTSDNTIFRSTISNNNAENIKIHLKKGTYTYSLCDAEITGVSLVVKDMVGQDILRTTSLRGANFTLSEDKDATIDWRVESGVTFSNTKFKAMIRLASDPDNTYQPYAMTNRELTESKANIIYGTNIWSANTPVTITLPRLGGLLVGGRSNKGFAIYVCENGNELVVLSGGDFVTASISDLTISLTFSSVYGTSFNWKYINSETGSY